MFKTDYNINGILTTRKKQIIFGLILVGLSLILMAAYSIKSRAPLPSSSNPDSTQTDSSEADGSEESPGPTENSEPGSSSNPVGTTNPGSPTASSPSPESGSASPKKQIIPILSALAYDDTAQIVIATGFVEGQFRATCTLTFEKAGYAKIVKSGPTEVKSNNRSVCPRFEIPKSDFPTAGDWTARLRIHSDSVEGTSDPGMVTIT